jgi:hypothetical protein
MELRQHSRDEENETKEEETWKRIKKQEIQNWTSNLFDFNNTLKVCKEDSRKKN